MDKRPSLNDLNAFVAIAGRRSFRQAARDLDTSPSSLTHALRNLEDALGVRLVHRTTRSVAPTDAGERLLRRIAPLLGQLDATLRETADDGEEPAGVLRLNVSETVARMLLDRVLPAFAARYPRVTLDISSEGRLVDIVAEGFDAGIRLGGTVPQDMVGVRFGGEVWFVAVASPAYLQRQGCPAVPTDLLRHRCIRVRMPSGTPYRWEFERAGEPVTIEVQGTLVLNSVALMVDAAAQGLGIAYVPLHAARQHLEAGRLRTVLDDWRTPPTSLHLYYPGHRHVPAALKALIEVLRDTLP